MKYYLGLDNGGTVTKAAIYDGKGRELALAAADTELYVPAPGFAERDMEEMWQTNASVIRQALSSSGVDPSDIACVAVTGHGKGLYLWGKDGKPVRRGIISTDNRAWRYPLEWERSGVAEKAMALSRQHILASQPVSLLAWLRDNEPGVIEKTQWIFECKDYVRFRLTGESRGERTDYSGTGLMNLNTGEYDSELLALFGLSGCAGKLPPLCWSAELCGAVTGEAAALTGLREGTPVAGGAFDIDACALAVDAADGRDICMIAGTWSINEYVSKSPADNGLVLMNSLFCLPGTYLIEESSPTSAGNNRWFIENLLPEAEAEAKKVGVGVYELMNRWAEEIAPNTFCPIFLPFIMGSNVHPNALGSFIGIDSSHTRSHLVRGIYEGIAFCHRYHYEKLLKTMNAPPRAIRLAGGAARSEVWTQIFADVMGLPVERVEVNETGALGCAIIGAVASGEYPDLSAAAKAMCRVSPAIEPDTSGVNVYDEKYRLYLKTVEALDGVWDTLRQYREKRRD